MLSPDQLQTLGYIEPLSMPTNNEAKNFTTVFMKFDINDQVEMDTLNELIKDICNSKVCCYDNLNTANNVNGLISMQMGIDLKQNVVYHSSVYYNPQSLDWVLIKLFDKFLKLICNTTMTELICTTAPKDVERCRWSLSRFYVPKKFLIIPSQISQGHLKSYHKNSKKESNQSEIIRVAGYMKIKQDVVDDDSLWNLLVGAFKAYNQRLSEIDDFLFIENAIDRESGTFYFAEHFSDKWDALKKAKFTAMEKKSIVVALLPLEMTAFCSFRNKKIFEKHLQQYKSKHLSVMEYS
jgi:hypothetical protein